MKRLAIGMAPIVTAMAVFAGVAMGNNNGQAIGQDPLRLALTQCSNAGGGNGNEIESGLLYRSVASDCFDKRFLQKYTTDEVAAIEAQSTCFVLVSDKIFFACEVDPGNSADNNHADG